MTPGKPFSVTMAPARLPVLLSVPHAGRAYSAELLGAARLSLRALAVLEDPLVDRLIERGVDLGAAAIVAHAPRAEIDLNRSLDDLDPAMVTPPPRSTAVSRRAGAGLGLIPSRLAGQGAVWRRSLTASEVERRIDAIHRPYHNTIGDRLSALRARFGVAVLIDCHSMPPRTGIAPGVVLGDCHGSSTGPEIVSAVESACQSRGLTSARNDPYAGGEIVARHGRPDCGIHALQIEIDRSLYLADDLRSAGPGLARIAACIGDIVEAVAHAATTHPVLVAAE